MSANAWSVCPRCAANEPGLEEEWFRAEFEVYGPEDGVVRVEYRGECQRCDLVFTFTSEHPIPDLEPEPNRPTGFVLRKTWAEVPAGWFVAAPGTPITWWEVVAVAESGPDLMVTMRHEDGRTGTWPRDPAGEVKVRRGTSTKAKDAALDALNAAGFTAHVIEDQIS